MTRLLSTLTLLTVAASARAVLVDDIDGLRQALSAGGVVDLESDIDLGGAEIVATADAVVRGNGHTIGQHGASHFLVNASLELRDIELAVVQAPTAKPTCAEPSTETSPTPAREALELLSVARAGPSTGGCGFSQSVGAGLSNVVIFGGRSASDADHVDDCEGLLLPGISTYVTDAWARTVDGSGALTTLDEDDLTGFVAVGTSGAVALLRTDLRSILFVAPDGRSTTYEWRGPTYYFDEGKEGHKIVVLDIRGDGDGAAGAVAVVALDPSTNMKERYLEVYAAATSTGPLELTASIHATSLNLNKVISRIAYDGAAIYAFGHDAFKERTLARVDVSADYSELKMVWTTGIGTFDGTGLLSFRLDDDGFAREVTVLHASYFVRVDARDGTLVLRRMQPDTGPFDQWDAHRISYDAYRDCYYSAGGTLLRRHNADTADEDWTIDVASAFDGTLAAIDDGPLGALGVHALSDGRVRLVLAYAGSTQIATLSGDEPVGDNVPTRLPTLAGCGGTSPDAGATEASCVAVAPGASLVATRVTFAACASAGDGGAVDAVDASVRIRDCSFNGTRAAGAGGAISVVRGALDVSGSAFAGARAGGGLGLGFSVDEALAGGSATLLLAEASYGGAVRAVDAKVSVVASSFTGVEAAGGGGAISSAGGTLEFADSTFYRCHAVGPGGAIDAAGDALRVAGSDFVKCAVPGKKTGEGGAIRSQSVSTTISGTLFEACATNKRQGAALIVSGASGSGDASRVTIESSRFLRHTARANGVVKVEKVATLRIRDSTFSDNDLSNPARNNNKLVERSVVILTEISDLQITGSTFARNKNQVLRTYALYPGTFLIADCVFANNEEAVRRSGGAFISFKSPLQDIRITRSLFLRNKLLGKLDGDFITSGGAIDLYDTATVDSCVFRENSADDGGAIGLRSTASMTVTNTSFVENVAVVGGALSACATDPDYVCGGDLVLADVVAADNAAKTADGEQTGGAFAAVNGAHTTIRGLELRGNRAAGAGSAVSFLYAYADLFGVRADPDQVFYATRVGRLDAYCSDVTIVREGGHALNVATHPGECSLCLAGTEWSGAPAYACEPCAPGFSKAANESACTRCGPGLFQNERGGSACKPCSRGRTPNPEATACERDSDDPSEWPPARVAGFTLLCLFVLIGLPVCGVAARRFVRRKRKLESERAVMVQQQVVEAAERVSEFQAHFYAVPGDTFVAMGSLKSHEELLAAREILVFPTLKHVRDAGAEGAVFVFLSHQWLGYETPDPNKVHYVAMCQAVRSVAAEASVALDKVRVWADFCSIPQLNRSEQRFAISSLPTFASCTDYFVVVAPNATHANTKCACDSKSYRRRAWCRAEIMSCWARNGKSDMCFSTNSGLKPLAMEDEDLVEALDVFAGDMTCCRLGHPDGQPCDREDLMLPMLGLFADMYRERHGRSRKAYETIEPILDQIYPRAFEWNFEPPGAAPAVETQILFGGLIDATKYAIDLAEAPRGDPIHTRKVPDFQPGTNAKRRLRNGARKKVQHASSSDSSLHSSGSLWSGASDYSRAVSRSDSVASVSWARSVSRSDSAASVRGKSPRSPGTTPRRPKYSRSLTWRASPPKHLTPTRYNSSPTLGHVDV